MNTALTLAVQEHLAFVTAQAKHIDATADAIDAFTASALTFADTLAEGVSANALATAIKSATEGLSKRDRGLAYTSAAAVGFHARTGRVLQLDDDLEPGFDVRDIQTAIKKLKVDVVDDIITTSDTRGDALVKLTTAVAQAEAESDEDGNKGPKTKDILTLLKAARGPVSKAAEKRTEGEAINEEAREVAREIAKLLDTVLAPESVTVTAAPRLVVTDEIVAALRDEVALP